MKKGISEGFQTFLKETPDHASAWGKMVGELNSANVLDNKTKALVYIGILAALGLESGLPYHVQGAKEAGATKEEVLHAALMALPPAGHKVTQMLPVIVESYEE